MRQKPIIPPTAEPISLVEAKLQCNVDADNTLDDTRVQLAIAAARDHAERWTGRQLVAATFTAALNYFPACVTLPYSPLISVDSIQYIDTGGALTTLAADQYQVDTFGEVWKIREAWSTSWPATRDEANAVRINFTAGYLAPFTAATTDVLTWSNRTPVDGELVRLTNTGGALPAGLSTATNYYVRDASGYTCKLAATSGGAAIDITGTGTGTHFIGALPDCIRQAMLLLIGHIYKHREGVVVGATVAELPMAIEPYLNMAKDWRAA